ncbi:hypothetical protein [Teichococcus aestuarii]|uniref:hypothetical protein n=1 Tax=Teichococcus aestuarii TaxID=568898 RepID=UPI003606092A
MLPVSADAALLFAFGLAIAIQPLIFAMTRAAVPPEEAGKALSAVNLSFFAGAAVLQAATGPVAAAGGVGMAIGFLGAMVLLGTVLFLGATRRRD